MEVINSNDSIRKKIVKYLTDGYDYDNDEVKMKIRFFYEKIKNDKEVLKPLLEVMFLTSYIVTNNTQVIYPLDDEVCHEMEFLDSINFIEELIGMLDFDTFYSLCQDTILFYYQDDYFKRKCMLNLVDNGYLLTSKFPILLNDFICYLAVYNEEEILDYYDMQKESQKNEKDAFKNAVNHGVKSLIKIQETDIDNYKKVLNSIASQYYNYNKYLLLNKEYIDEESKDLLSLIESYYDDFYKVSFDNYPILKTLVTGFLNYNKVSSDEKKKIDDYLSKSVFNKSCLNSNPNARVRKMLFDLFNGVDLSDENVLDNYKDKLDYLKNNNVFDYVIKVLYLDTFTLIYDSYDCLPNDKDNIEDFNYIKSFNNISDFKNMLLEDDYVLLDYICNSICFDSYPFLSKKMIYLNMVNNNIFNDFISSEYQYDLLEYSRDYNICDACMIYDECLMDYDDKKSAYDVSCWNLHEDLFELSVINEDNYNDVIYDICNMVYKYIKWSIKVNGTDDEMIKIINHMENHFDIFLDEIEDDIDRKMRIYQLFYDYVSLSSLNKARVQTYYDKLKKAGKVKTLNKKNKNS